MSQHSETLYLRYKAYLVRFWQEGEQEPWRASAQSVQSGEVVHFATLHELFIFLEMQTPTIPSTSQGTG
jgi:hypothetical protein